MYIRAGNDSDHLTGRPPLFENLYVSIRIKLCSIDGCAGGVWRCNKFAIDNYLQVATTINLETIHYHSVYSQGSIDYSYCGVSDDNIRVRGDVWVLDCYECECVRGARDV